MLEDQVMRHMEREEATMKKHGEKIDFIADSVGKLSEQLQVDTLQTEIKIARAQEETRNHVRDNYATRREVNDGLASIRDSARLIWFTIVACVAVIAWFIDKLL